MAITERDIERIPPGNLRVPRREFAAVWAEAERIDAEKDHGDRPRMYVAGVVLTCRWMACSTEVFNYPRGPQRSPAAAPVTATQRLAHEELIEAETRSAEYRLTHSPQLLALKPGFYEAVYQTLCWAWRGTAEPPLEVDRAGVK